MPQLSCRSIAWIVLSVIIYNCGSPIVRANSAAEIQIEPTKWQYRSIQSLTERYQCGTIDRPGDRDRRKLANRLNDCLKRLPNLIGVTPEDLETIRRLQLEFAPELAKLEAKIDRLETSVDRLASQQFSTTTKLTGQAIFAFSAGTFGGNRIIAPRGATVTNSQPNATIPYRVNFDLNTSFAVNDLLKLRLVSASAGSRDNAAGFLEPNFGSVLGFAVPGREQVSISALYYSFKPTPDLNVTIGPQMAAPDIIDKNRYANLNFRDFSTAALTNNFILIPRPIGAGAAIEWTPKSSPFALRTVYIASGTRIDLPENQQFLGGGAPNDLRLFPTSGGGATGGLFGDPYLGAIELEYAPTQFTTVRLQYSGGKLLGSNFQVLGANAEVALSPKVGLFARYGYGSYPNTTIGNISPQYWSAGIAFRDLFTTSDMAGIGIAQPFTIGEIGDASQTNFEAFYNLPISNNVRITPLFQVITNPANSSSNGTIVTGTLRTVFSF